ncbi:hypothetical protein D3C73_1004810 [compost metagenome]
MRFDAVLACKLLNLVKRASASGDSGRQEGFVLDNAQSGLEGQNPHAIHSKCGVWCEQLRPNAKGLRTGTSRQVEHTAEITAFTAYKR